MRSSRMADRARRRDAVHFRHLHIHQHQVEIAFLNRDDGPSTVVDPSDRMTCSSEHRFDDVSIHFEVVRDQNARGVGDEGGRIAG